MRLLITIAAVFSLALASAFPAGSVIKDSQGMDCFVYTPDPIVPGKTYQIVVGVHGANGNGKNAAGMKNWADRGDVIVIGPSFQTKGERPFQNGDGVHAEKLIALFDTLKKQHKLHDKMFLHGFSGGSQFVHRFAMLHPKLVCGVSAHSGGTWATDNYGEIRTSAKHIPFAISCGEKDTGKAFGAAPYNRLE
jgi:poly(3-hydroxybutyrate) depolymerase